jgi:signal transduction histidine kinase
MPVQISPIVKEALKLLRSSLPTTIKMRQSIEERPAIIEANPTQIHQILMNLCTNAAHAMREEGGSLEVAITQVHVERWYGESFPKQMRSFARRFATTKRKHQGSASGSLQKSEGV